MSNTPPTLMTTIEAAKFVRLSPTKLQQLRTKGGGPHYIKAGRGNGARVLYALEDLNDWVGQKFGSTSEEPLLSDKFLGQLSRPPREDRCIRSYSAA